MINTEAALPAVDGLHDESYFHADDEEIFRHQALTFEDLCEAELSSFRSLAADVDTIAPFVPERICNLLLQYRVDDDHDKELQASIGLKLSNFSFISLRFRSVVLQQPPTLTECTMRSYQLEGVSWLVQHYLRRVNCILADEMVRRLLLVDPALILKISGTWKNVAKHCIHCSFAPCS